MTLFCTALLHEQQDRISKAVVCDEEALWTRREVDHDARDDSNSSHLFATSVDCMPQSRIFCVKKYRIKLRFSLNVRPAGPTSACLSITYLPSCLPTFLTF